METAYDSPATTFPIGVSYLEISVIVPETTSRIELTRLIGTAREKQNLVILDDFIEARESMDIFRKELFRYVKRYLGNSEDAQDVMNEIWIKVKNNRNKFNPSRNFRPWLFTLATNCCIDYQRKNKRHNKVSRLDNLNITNIGDENGKCFYGDILRAPFEKIAEYKENSEIVRRGLSMLPIQLRQIIELVYFQGLKYREASELLGIPERTVKSRLSNAKKSLRKKLNDYNCSKD